MVNKDCEIVMMYRYFELTSDVEVGGVRVGDSDTILSDTLIFAFVWLLTVSYL